MKKVLSIILAALLLCSTLVGCALTPNTNGGDDGTSAEPTEKHAKIGVLTYSATDSEALAFQSYYQDYIPTQYDVEFVYSDEITDAEGEISALENMLTQGCQGIISLSSYARPDCIEMCEDAGVYYAIAAGTLGDEDYEAFKDYQFYVGSIGPSLEQEYQVGYDMAKYYIDEGYTNYVIYTGGYPYVDMHWYRTDGIVQAFVEAGATYTPNPAFGFGELSGGDFTFQVITDFPDAEGAFFADAAQKIGADGVEVVLTSAIGVECFASTIASINPEIKLATVSAFTEAYKDAANADPSQVDYLVGKFASSIGPVFAAVYNCIQGDADAMRDNGCAFRIDQGYWAAKGVEEFNTMYEAANSSTEPAYDAALLDTIITTRSDVDFASFEAFVEAYSFEDITAAKAA